MTSLCALIACSDFPSLAALLTIYAVAAVLSGLSGFGFSAIGCLSFAVLSPELAVAMLMGLSLLTQAFGAAALWSDLRRYMTPWRRRDGVMPYLVGGVVGLPLGIALLSGLATRELKIGRGLMLIGYATWSLLRVPTAGARREPNATRSFFVAAAAA